MGEKADLRAALAQCQRQSAGLLARATGQEYRTASPELRPRYHTKRTCPEGLDILPENLIAGRGDRTKLCDKCQSPATK
jgi:hypothetical protein